MLEIIFFILPGFAGLISVYKRQKIRNIPYTHWILIPIFVIYSLAGHLIYKLLEKCLPNIPNVELLSIQFDVASSIVAAFIVVILTRFRFFDFMNLFLIFAPMSAVEKFLDDNKKEAIMVSLENGKVYVGLLVGSDIWSKDGLNSLMLQLLFSGYREDSEKGKQILVINTNYIQDKGDGAYDYINENLETTILFKKIISLRLFDFTGFSHFIKNGTARIEGKSLEQIFPT